MSARFLIAAGRSGGAPADGEPFSANVPRPAASSFISLRKAPRQRVRSKERSLISVASAACPSAQGIGCSAQRNKGGGRSPGDIRGGEYPVAFAPAPNS